MPGEVAYGDAALRQSVSKLELFADLDEGEVAGLVALLEEAAYDQGEWVIRRGETGVGLYVIVDGEAAVVLDHHELTVLQRGMFFGEISALLGVMTSADVIARTPLRCLIVPADELEGFLLSQPRVLLRMLHAEARRIREKDEILL
jgi:CRP/FNR family cyclic AMP-dependent transcriptional regulator